MSEQEVELKLSLDARGATRLRRAAAVHARKTARARTRRLVATYFDTPRCALREAGLALRIRKEGRALIQTVKARVSGDGPIKSGLQTRREINVPIRAATPDLGLIEDADLRARLVEVIGAEELVALFTTDIKRTAWQLDLDGARVELVLDIGAIEGAGRSVPVREAELEVLSGSPKVLLDFAADLRERVPFRLSGSSKAARGFALHRGTQPMAVSGKLPPLNRAMNAHEALSSLLRGAVGQMLANEAVVGAGTDPEGVHQMRVASRRARAALAAFRPWIGAKSRKRAAKDLKWLQKAMGPARDYDVFVAETLGPLLKSEPDHKGLKALAARAEKKRRKAYERARAALDDPRYQDLLLGLEGWVFTDQKAAAAQPVSVIAKRLLDDRLEAVWARAGKDPTTLDLETLHALRIDIKTLRYALEFFAGLYPKADVDAFIKTTKKLQNCLGALNDAVVADDLLRDLAGGGKNPEKRLGKGTVQRVRAAQQARIEAGLEKLARSWDRFQAQPRFWDQD